MLPSLFPATVVRRPALTNKSPYACDVLVNEKELLCHSPGLGCSGLVAAGRRIWVSRNTSTTTKTRCTAQIAECMDSEGSYTVGIHPMISQNNATGLLDRLGLGSAISWKSEVVVADHTRIDFVGTDRDSRKVYVEVKTAMISHQLEKPRATRRAVFPEGFRKKKDEPVSSSRKTRGTEGLACAKSLSPSRKTRGTEGLACAKSLSPSRKTRGTEGLACAKSLSPRAVKHAEVLADLATRPDTRAAILLFVVPRSDCGGGLEINSTDRVYSMAIDAALRAGVVVRVFELVYAVDGSVVAGRELPLFLPFCTTSHIRKRQ
jgi:DNA-binding sugar fermentation-stimulating protein